ncbi:DUF732 domain-containing protein [Pseudonocardia sp. RS11V-5]|uniref:DUF732 domain-containing protein n=1 Tax=Pseudonocardia terrae TaxID=2905831 RepID=UPI001E5EDC88|nr:DUF732 domain-containing protein [Pseudonocardia terrae]MCE3555237.1 DUF732 domain-containing protein [Pseudonocardia terrae]
MPAGPPGRHVSGPRHAPPQVPAPRDPSLGQRFAPSAPPPGYGVPGYGPQPYTPPLPPAPASRVPRWVLPAALVAVILGAGAAIGGISAAALATGTGDTTTVAAGTGDRAFLAAVSTRPALAEVPPDTLIEVGHGVCSSLEGGATRGELVSAAVSAGFGTRDAQVLVDAAHTSYCPAV